MSPTTLQQILTDAYEDHTIIHTRCYGTLTQHIPKQETPTPKQDCTKMQKIPQTMHLKPLHTDNGNFLSVGGTIKYPTKLVRIHKMEDPIVPLTMPLQI